VIGVAAMAVLLIVLGLAGESDRRAALDYGPVRAQIAASAPLWAVTE
jgi:hypothetical protein